MERIRYCLKSQPFFNFYLSLTFRQQSCPWGFTLNLIINAKASQFNHYFA
ncbi:hypothetical protein [uncultured Gammaproteobacteria bacterium]|nr:hypothetical protein [uncultured Gammaproteobacteria bacterium]